MTTPARVSGPGALSQRTDGGQKLMHIPDAKYGEDKANIAQQKMAPLGNSAEGAAGPSFPTSGGAPMGPARTPIGGISSNGPAAPPQDITPFTAPTTDPNQHVTTGMAPLGGAPSQPAAPQVQPGQLSTALAPYFAADDTGILADFAWKLAEMGI